LTRANAVAVTDTFDPAQIETDVRRWLERAVIGLNLCPFAKAVYVKDQVRIVISDASTNARCWKNSARNSRCCATRLQNRSTPPCWCIRRYWATSWTTTISSATPTRWSRRWTWTACCRSPASIRSTSSPAASPTIDNLTNRSPYPILHLLREASIDRAVAAYPDPDAIIARNIATVRELGVEGWSKLLAE
jgi:hypothetical protein